jgi:hypothetical protein
VLCYTLLLQSVVSISLHKFHLKSVKIVTIKSILFFLIILLLAFSFFIQVMTSSPLPALVPYVLLACVFLLTLYQRPSSLIFRWSAHKRITFLIGVYLVSVFFNTGWQAILGFINPLQGVSAIVVFVLPVLFFVYFRSFATNQEFRAVFFAILTAGLISSVFYVYDSYSMWILGQVSDYSHSAMEYITMRAGNAPNQNMARVSSFGRSHGLLEKHSVSAAWIVLGCFATLTLLPIKKTIKRMNIVIIFGIILLIAQNTTSIAVFAFVVFIMEYSGHTFLYRGISKRIVFLLRTIIFSLVSVGLILLILTDSLGDRLFTTIWNHMATQVDIVTGASNNRNEGYFDALIDGFISYPDVISKYPIVLLIGDGYSTFGFPKGSHFGILESLHRFGMPLFSAILIGLMSLIRHALKQMYYKSRNQPPERIYLWFAVSATLYIVLTDIHYSIWPMKSILPIMFINLAIFDRYLYSTAQRRQQ